MGDNDTAGSHPLFDVLAFGRFPPALMQIEYEPAPRPTHPAIEAMIAREWQRRAAEARDGGRLLFNGHLLRYVRHAVRGSRNEPVFQLAVGPTCYRDFVGTNLFNHHRLGEFDWKCFANPVGTTATLTTTDDRIVYGRRSDRVAYHAGHVHTFGGALEPRDRDAAGRIDAFGSVLRELHEELGLRPADLDPLVCVGLVRDREIVQPELLFETRVRTTFDELLTRWNTATARDEHVEIVSLPDQPDAILPFIQSCRPIAPVAVAALLLLGRHRWGEGWYRDICMNAS